jgi:hypothetical protein
MYIYDHLVGSRAAHRSTVADAHDFRLPCCLRVPGTGSSKGVAAVSKSRQRGEVLTPASSHETGSYCWWLVSDRVR